MSGSISATPQDDIGVAQYVKFEVNTAHAEVMSINDAKEDKTKY